MAFEFGMFHEFQCPAGKSQEQAFAESFEQVDAAERWGLDAMWLAEIHMAPERSVLAAPLTIASAIAARTSRIKIGTAVQVLPLCHPLRIAEEAATVDQVRRAWTEPAFSFSGNYYNFQNVHLAPKPYQKPHPEIRVAANSADTFPAVGRLGYGIFVAVRLGTLSELAPNIRAYREAWKAAGHPGEGKVFLRVPVYVAETAEQARTEPEESIMYFYRYLGERLEDSATRAGVRAVEERAARGRRLQTITYEEALRDKIIVGTPDAVADRLAQLKEELGLDGILAEMNCGTKIPHPKVMKSLQLLCQQVMPRFQ